MEELISNIILDLLSYMAEKARIKIRQCQRKDIEKACQNGIYLDKPKIDADNFKYYYNQVYNKNRV